MSSSSDGGRRPASSGGPAGTRQVDAVIYDFGGVFMASPFEAIRNLGEEQGCPYELAVEIVFGPYGEDTDHPWHRAERGEIDIRATREGIRELSHQHGYDFDLFALFKYLGGGEVCDEMVACVRRVRAAGCATAVLTNNVAEARGFWRPMLPLDELFDAVVDSSQVGMRKPDPRIFEYTLTALGGIDAGRAAFLDDFEGHVRAASALGMRGIQVMLDPTDAIASVDSLIG